MSPVEDGFKAYNSERYAESVHIKTGSLDKFMVFIYGTFIDILRPSSSSEHNIVYNGHKIKHALKYQSLAIPYGLVIHTIRPIKGRIN